MEFINGQEPRRQNIKKRSNEPIIVHRRHKNSQNKVLIVFVHGIMGKRYETWGEYPSGLYKDVDAADIGLYYYRTFKFICIPSVDIDKEAEILSGIIRDDKKYERFILLGHSLAPYIIWREKVPNRIS